MTRPPGLASWFITLLTPSPDRDVVLGDLTEGFFKHVTHEGLAGARRWYWRQVGRSIVPSLVRRSSSVALPPKGTLMNGFWQDVRFNVRTAWRRPLVASVAILSLTVGIAMTTVVFGLMDAAMLRPIAAEDPGELSLITEQRTQNVNFTLPYLDYVDWRQGQQAFVDMLASGRTQLSVQVGTETALLNAEQVSGSYFTTLGIRAAAGRLLTPEDDLPSSAPAVVVSRRLWERFAGAGTDFATRTITINNTAFTIVGLAPARFSGIHVGERAELWTTLNVMGVISPATVGGNLRERRASWLWLMGRRKPGVTHEAAAAELQRVEDGLAPTVGRPTPKRLRVSEGLRGTDRIPATTGETLRVLLAASGLVLLVACANVANLLLARSADRRRELVVRTALGASRWRLVRLLTLDAAVMALVAGGVGLLIAWPLGRLAASLMAVFGTPMAIDVSPDWRMAGFALGLGLASSVLASVVPALQILLSFKGGATEAGSRSTTGGRIAGRLRQVLLVVQFALAVALVVAAGLLLRTVGNLRTSPTGFDTDQLALIGVDVSVTSYPQPKVRQYISEARRRLAAVAGVDSVGFATVVPVGFGGSRRSVEIPGYSAAPDEDLELNYNAVSGDYFAAMGIDIVAGRPLTAADDDSLAVMVVNETMAHRYWPGGRAVGATVDIGADQPLTVVGVARDAKYRMLREEPRPSFYVPVAAQRVRWGSFHVRTSMAPDVVLPALRQAVASTDPLVPLADVRTLRTQADANITDDRVAMTIGLALASAALILAAVGLFGSMTYLVTQRTRELGIRMALGADGRRIHTLVLRQGLTVALAGAAVGLVASIWTTRAIEARLFGVTPADPVSFTTAVFTLAVVALSATILPARRAARVDPIEALRDE